MAAFEEPGEHALNLRERARSHAAGTDVAPWNSEAPPESLLQTDRFARLRAELAEAVAAAELVRVRKDCELARQECETWRAIANERARALERADLALQALATVMTKLDPRTTPAVPSPEVTAVSRELATATRELAAAARAAAEARDADTAHHADADAPVAAVATSPTPPPVPEVSPPPAIASFREHDADMADTALEEDDDIVAIPTHVREEAARYAQTMHAMEEYKLDLVRPRHWWQFWR